jgi:Arabinose efflux permease
LKRNADDRSLEATLYLLSIGLGNSLTTGLQPLLPYYLRSIGATVEQLGTVLAVSRASVLALLPLGGLLTDMLGRKTVLVLSPLIISLAYVLLSYATTWEMTILPLALAFLPTAIAGPAIFAYMAELTSAEKYGRFYGLYFAVYNAATVLGYVAAGYLAEQYGYKVLFLATSATMLATAALRMGLRETRGKRERRSASEELAGWVRAARNEPVPTLVLLRSLSLAHATVLTAIYLPLLARDRAGLGESDLTFMFAVESLLFAALVPLGGRLIEGNSWARFVAIELFLRSLAGLLLIVQPTQYGIFAALIVGSGLAIFLQPFVDARTSASVPASVRGRIWSVQQFSHNLAIVLLTYVSGVLWESLGPEPAIASTFAYILVMAYAVHRLRSMEPLARVT